MSSPHQCSSWPRWVKAASNSFEALVARRILQGFARGTLTPGVFPQCFCCHRYLAKGCHDAGRRAGRGDSYLQARDRWLDQRNLLMALNAPDQHRARHHLDNSYRHAVAEKDFMKVAEGITVPRQK